MRDDDAAEMERVEQAFGQDLEFDRAEAKKRKYRWNIPRNAGFEGADEIDSSDDDEPKPTIEFELKREQERLRGPL